MQYVLHEVTPGQALLLMDRTWRRKIMAEANNLELAYMASASARGSRKGWNVIRQVAKGMRERAGAVERSGWRRLIEKLKLSKV